MIFDEEALSIGVRLPDSEARRIRSRVKRPAEIHIDRATATATASQISNQRLAAK